MRGKASNRGKKIFKRRGRGRGRRKAKNAEEIDPVKRDGKIAVDFLNQKIKLRKLADKMKLQNVEQEEMEDEAQDESENFDGYSSGRDEGLSPVPISDEEEEQEPYPGPSKSKAQSSSSSFNKKSSNSKDFKYEKESNDIIEDEEVLRIIGELEKEIDTSFPDNDPDCSEVVNDLNASEVANVLDTSEVANNLDTSEAEVGNDLDTSEAEVGNDPDTFEVGNDLDTPELEGNDVVSAEIEIDLHAPDFANDLEPSENVQDESSLAPSGDSDKVGKRKIEISFEDTEDKTNIQYDKEVSGLLNHGPYSRILFVGDSNLKLLEKCWPEYTYFRPQFLIKPDLTLDNVKDFLLSRTELPHLENGTLLIVCVGLYDIIKFEDHEECTNIEGHKAMKFLTLQENSVVDLSKLVMMKLNRTYQSLERILDSSSVVSFGSINPCDPVLHFQEMSKSHHSSSAHRVDIPLEQLTETKSKLNIICDKINKQLYKFSSMPSLWEITSSYTAHQKETSEVFDDGLNINRKVIERLAVRFTAFLQELFFGLDISRYSVEFNQDHQVILVGDSRVTALQKMWVGDKPQFCCQPDMGFYNFESYIKDNLKGLRNKVVLVCLGLNDLVRYRDSEECLGKNHEPQKMLVSCCEEIKSVYTYMEKVACNIKSSYQTFVKNNSSMLFFATVYPFDLQQHRMSQAEKHKQSTGHDINVVGAKTEEVECLAKMLTMLNGHLRYISKNTSLPVWDTRNVVPSESRDSWKGFLKDGLLPEERTSENLIRSFFQFANRKLNLELNEDERQYKYQIRPFLDTKNEEARSISGFNAITLSKPHKTSKGKTSFKRDDEVEITEDDAKTSNKEEENGNPSKRHIKFPMPPHSRTEKRSSTEHRSSAVLSLIEEKLRRRKPHESSFDRSRERKFNPNERPRLPSPSSTTDRICGDVSGFYTAEDSFTRRYKEKETTRKGENNERGSARGRSNDDREASRRQFNKERENSRRRIDNVPERARRPRDDIGRNSKDDEQQSTGSLGLYNAFIRKIEGDCRLEERFIRDALLDLFDTHKRECERYLDQPDAYPDYAKEYRTFCERKRAQICELGGDHISYNYLRDWGNYWPTRLIELFQASWFEKKQQCKSMLSKKRRSRSPSSSSSSSSSSRDSRSRKRKHSKKTSKRSKASPVHKRTDQRESERKWYKERDTNKWRPLGSAKQGQGVNMQDPKRNIDIVLHTQSLFEPSSSSSQSMMASKNVETAPGKKVKLLELLGILTYMKDKLGVFGMPISVLYEKATSLEKAGADPNLILKDDETAMLLNVLNDKFETIIENDPGSVIQKAIMIEAQTLLKNLLDELKVIKKKSKLNVNHEQLARLTMGQNTTETIRTINNFLIYEGCGNVLPEELEKIYVAVKEEQLKINKSSQTRVGGDPKMPEEEKLVSIINVLERVTNIKELIGKLSSPVYDLYYKCVTLQRSGADPNSLLNNNETGIILNSLKDNIMTILNEGRASDKVVLFEAESQLKYLLDIINKRNTSYSKQNINYGQLARLTMGQTISETISTIKDCLVRKGNYNVSPDTLEEIYVAVKEEQMKLKTTPERMTISTSQERSSYDRVDEGGMLNERSSFDRRDGSGMSNERSSFDRRDGGSLLNEISSYDRRVGGGISNERSSYERRDKEGLSNERPNYNRRDGSGISRTDYNPPSFSTPRMELTEEFFIGQGPGSNSRSRPFPPPPSAASSRYDSEFDEEFFTGRKFRKPDFIDPVAKNRMNDQGDKRYVPHKHIIPPAAPVISGSHLSRPSPQFRPPSPLPESRSNPNQLTSNLDFDLLKSCLQSLKNLPH